MSTTKLYTPQKFQTVDKIPSIPFDESMAVMY